MSDFTDLVLCGYQGWFAAVGRRTDTVGRWKHWSRQGVPRPEATSFELYPDVREYPDAALERTEYGRLGNGEESRLFGSERDGVADLHFGWMAEYGIDGAVLQRFLQPLRHRPHLEWRNAVGRQVRRAAEAHDRFFYVMYDVSGRAGWPFEGKSLADELEDDFVAHVKAEMIPSAGYARQGGRPVIAIWGFGFVGRQASQTDALEIIRRLREDHGCYVVGGVPYHWRHPQGQGLPGWRPVYRALDMLIPWSVGAYRRSRALPRHFDTWWKKDRRFCLRNGIDLQRVIFPGFAWSNLKAQQQRGGAEAPRNVEDEREEAPRNAVSRDGGNFLWGQAHHVAELRKIDEAAGTDVVHGAFIAMFDEYDEGTAIAKAAEDDTMIPTDEYFLTLDADGERLPSDHYLWLAGEAARMIKDPDSATPAMPLRRSTG